MRAPAPRLIPADRYQAAVAPLTVCMNPWQPAIWILLLASTIATFYIWIGA
jgi:hypothetical protein